MSQTLDLSTLLRARRTAPPAPPQANLPTPEREQIRPRVANASLDDRCEVLRFLSVEDETGGITEMWTQAGAYPCRIEEAGAGGEGTGTAGNVQSAAPYRVYLPLWAQVKTSDRLGVPGWFNAWKAGENYATGDKVIPTLADGYIYECEVPHADASEPNWSDLGLSPWKRLRRVQFLEIEAVLDAVSGEDVLPVTCKEVQ